MKQIRNTITTLLIAGLLLACSEEKKTTEKFVRPVKYKEVVYLGGGSERSFSGTAKNEKIINLSFRSTGIITKFDMKLGTVVKKGQLLGTLDNVQARLAYEQAVTQLNSAESQMNTSNLSLNRVRSLYEKGSASLSDFESAKNAAKTAEESYKSAKRGVAIQQDQIQFGYLYAPEDGVIATVNKEIDETASPGETVAVLNAGSDMEINLGIPESIINRVKNGMDVNVTITSLQNADFKGKVTEVAPAVDVNTATYPVRVTIVNPTDAIKSGMAANVSFSFGDAKAGASKLVVPVNAVGEDSKGRFVFVIENTGEVSQVKKQHITLGALTEEGFVVTEGLQLGQKIATAGLQTLLDGQEVKVQ